MTRLWLGVTAVAMLLACDRERRDFSVPNGDLIMATRRGLVKKTPLMQYGRPMRVGISTMRARLAS